MGATASACMSSIEQPSVYKDGRVPIIGLGGTPFVIYNYVTTLVAGFDQYSDCAGVRLAFSCGWDKAWIMASMLGTSYALQAASAYWFVGGDGLFNAIAGVDTESAALRGHKDEIKTHAILSVVKLVTEIVPQSILSVLFALQVKPNHFIWVSVGLSLAVGIKSFAHGARYFLGSGATPSALAV